MTFKTREESLAAFAIIWDPAIDEEVQKLSLELHEQNSYFGALFQISKFLSDKKIERLEHAIVFVENGSMSKENRSALILLILNLYKTYHGGAPADFLINNMKGLSVDWTKTNRNICIAMQLIAPDDWQKYQDARTPS